ERVPRIQEGDHRNRDERGLRIRQDNMPENLTGVRAVDSRCLIELAWDLGKRLTQQEDGEWIEDERQEKRPVRVLQPEVADGNKEWYDDDVKGDQHRCDDDSEKRVSATKGHAAQRKRGGRAEQQRAHDLGKRNQ